MLNALFVAYQNASDFTMVSQGLSYIEGLSGEGVSFSLLTFETKGSLENSAKVIKDHNLNLNWRYNIYHKRPRFLATCLDVLGGMLSVFLSIKKNKIHLVHARGVVPVILSYLPARLLGARLFFDTRGLLADKYVGGRLLKANSLTYKLIKRGEDFLLKHSDAFTVETTAHAQVIKDTNPSLYSRIHVIPCCVDLDKFNRSLPDRKRLLNGHRDNNFNGQIIFSYVGKIGTWYLLSEMIDFFKIFLSNFSNAQLRFLSQDAEQERIYHIFKSKGIDLSKGKVIRPPNHDQIIKLLTASTAGIFFIHPYKRYNSSPIKFAEYLAAGLPVVINSGIGDTEEITRRERVGAIVNNFSTTSYQVASVQLLDLLREKENLRQRCRTAAEKYLSLKRGTEEYRRIYAKLIKR